MNGDAASHHVSAPIRAGHNTYSLILRVFVVCAALLIYAAEALLTDLVEFGAYTLLLLAYLFAEIRFLWVRNARKFWINPVVLASILTFVVPFGVTNIMYVVPDLMPVDDWASVDLMFGATRWMNQLMLYVVLAACAMWSGYRSAVGRNVGRMLQQSHALRKCMKISGRANITALSCCLAIGVSARLAAIALGVYGYASTYDELVAAANYSQYLSMAGSLGSLALLGAAINYYGSPVSRPLDRAFLMLALGCEVFFGFLSGFKGAVVMPFVVVAFAYYSQRNRFPIWMAPGIVIAIIVAFAVIEPFRVNRNQDAGFVGKSVGSIGAAMPSLSSIQADEEGDLPLIGPRFVLRMNLTYVASLGIEYAANYQLTEDSPAFLENVLLAPAHALVPRVVWEGKSLQNLGMWYTNVVLGRDLVSSTGMSPITYLNFCGGPLAIILGFLVVGIVQRGVFDGLGEFGNGGRIVLLGILGTLTSIDSAFNSVIIAVIRLVPLLIVAQYVLLVRPRR